MPLSSILSKPGVWYKESIDSLHHFNLSNGEQELISACFTNRSPVSTQNDLTAKYPSLASSDDNSIPGRYPTGSYWRTRLMLLSRSVCSCLLKDEDCDIVSLFKSEIDLIVALFSRPTGDLRAIDHRPVLNIMLVVFV